MEKCLGQPVVFVNKPGAGGELGFAELANAKPDGYTIGALNVPNFPPGTLTKENPAYKLDSFAFLGNLYGSIVTINAKRAANTRRLPKWSRPPRPARSTWASSNFGADDHIKMLRLHEGGRRQVHLHPDVRRRLVPQRRDRRPCRRVGQLDDRGGAVPERICRPWPSHRRSAGPNCRTFRPSRSRVSTSSAAPTT